MKLNAATRLLAYEKWSEKVQDKIEKKSEDQAHDLKPEIWEQSPSMIAHELKTKSKDFKQAISRISYYVNRAGKNLDPAMKRKLEQAKSAVYKSYGKEEPSDEN